MGKQKNLFNGKKKKTTKDGEVQMKIKTQIFKIYEIQKNQF